jgi:hypothetical protein
MSANLARPASWEPSWDLAGARGHPDDVGHRCRQDATAWGALQLPVAASYLNRVVLARSETIPAPGSRLLGRKLGL